MRSLWIIMIATIVIILMIFFYAAFFFSFEEAPQVVDEVNEISVSEDIIVTDAQDVVIFAFQRNYPRDLQKYVLQYKGLSDEAGLDSALKNQDYITLLKALWSEPDADVRLQWLREKEGESHPILLFELAVEIIKKEPDLEHFEEALALLELAKYRTELDASCATDASVGTASQSLYRTYAKAIADEITQFPELVEEINSTPEKVMTKAVLEQLLLYLQEVKDNFAALPSSDWVAEHALQKLFLEKEVVLSQKECQERKKKLLNLFIAKTQEALDQTI